MTIPEQFTTLQSPLGPLGVNGGEAVAISENNTIVGWTRYQGFQGGPTTRFYVNQPPVNLGALGFDATVTDISDHTDIIIGGGLRMDLVTGVVTDLGIPAPLQPGNLSFNAVLGYAVNDAAQSVLAARLATSLPDKYLTYRHTDATGYLPHNPVVLPSVFPGFYDINNYGDISASGGVYFAAEDQLVGGFDGLLTQQSSGWDTSLGFIDDARRVATTAFHAATGTNALVWLIPAQPAGVALRNGSGVNPTAFQAINTPVLGETWLASIDLISSGGVAAWIALSLGPEFSAATPLGELLIQTPWVAKFVSFGTVSLPLNAKYPLAGVVVRAQAAIFDATSLQLSNALDLTLGY